MYQAERKEGLRPLHLVAGEIPPEEVDVVEFRFFPGVFLYLLSFCSEWIHGSIGDRIRWTDGIQGEGTAYETVRYNRRGGDWKL